MKKDEFIDYFILSDGIIYLQIPICSYLGFVKKVRILYFILTSCFIRDGKSQGVNIDSMVKLVKNSRNDSNKVNLLNILAWELKDSKTSESLKYATEALNLAKKLAFKTGYTRGLSNAGIAYYYQGNYAKALKNYIAAAKLLDGTIYKKRQGAIYNNIALIYLDLLNYKDAETYFLKSLKIDQEFQDFKGLGDSFNNLGLVYKDQNNNQKALDYFNQSLMYRKKANDEEGLPTTFTNMGVVNTALKNYKIAEEQLFKGYDLYTKFGDTRGASLVNIDIGDLYSVQRKYPAAITFYKQSLDSSIKENEKTFISYCYLQLAHCYSKINGFQQAYHYHVEYMKVKDSIFNKDNSIQLSEIQTKYETEKKEKELVKSLAESDKQAAIKNIFIVSFILMVFLAFFVFRGYYGKKKANKVIIAQKNLVDAKNNEILDSMHYAKRIQQSLLTSEKFIDKTLKRLNK